MKATYSKHLESKTREMPKDDSRDVQFHLDITKKNTEAFR